MSCQAWAEVLMMIYSMLWVKDHQIHFRIFKCVKGFYFEAARIDSYLYLHYSYSHKDTLQETQGNAILFEVITK